MVKTHFHIPKNKWARFVLGWSLITGGIFGFLPVLGFWMIPLGMFVLSTDSPSMRRARRRTQVWLGRKGLIKVKQNHNKERNTNKDD